MPETILVVEDDAFVRELAVRSLEECGYEVLKAADPVEALGIAEGHPGPIHLLLTDLRLPGVNGVDLARQIGGSMPSIRVLFMSGFPAEAISDHDLLEPGTAFLQKPFKPRELAQRVQEILA